ASVSSQSAARNTEGPAQSTDQKTSIAARIRMRMAQCSFAIVLSVHGSYTGSISLGLHHMHRPVAPFSHLNQEIFDRPVYGCSSRPDRAHVHYPADLRSRYLCSPESTSSERWLWMRAVMTTTPVVRWGESAVMRSSG